MWIFYLSILLWQVAQNVAIRPSSSELFQVDISSEIRRLRDEARSRVLHTQNPFDALVSDDLYADAHRNAILLEPSGLAFLTSEPTMCFNLLIDLNIDFNQSISAIVNVPDHDADRLAYLSAMHHLTEEYTAIYHARLQRMSTQVNSVMVLIDSASEANGRSKRFLSFLSSLGAAVAIAEATAALGLSISNAGRLSAVEEGLEHLDGLVQQQYAAIRLNAEMIKSNRRSLELLDEKLARLDLRLNKVEYRAQLMPHFAALIEEKLAAVSRAYMDNILTSALVSAKDLIREITARSGPEPNDVYEIDDYESIVYRVTQVMPIYMQVEADRPLAMLAVACLPQLKSTEVHVKMSAKHHGQFTADNKALMEVLLEPDYYFRPFAQKLSESRLFSADRCLDRMGIMICEQIESDTVLEQARNRHKCPLPPVTSESNERCHWTLRKVDSEFFNYFVIGTKYVIRTTLPFYLLSKFDSKTKKRQNIYVQIDQQVFILNLGSDETATFETQPHSYILRGLASVTSRLKGHSYVPAQKIDFTFVNDQHLEKLSRESRELDMAFNEISEQSAKVYASIDAARAEGPNDFSMTLVKPNFLMAAGGTGLAFFGLLPLILCVLKKTKFCRKSRGGTTNVNVNLNGDTDPEMQRQASVTSTSSKRRPAIKSDGLVQSVMSIEQQCRMNQPVPPPRGIQHAGPESPPYRTPCTPPGPRATETRTRID